MRSCVAECCRVLQSVAVCCSVLQSVAVCSSVQECVAVCCTVLQCVAVCCSGKHATAKISGKSVKVAWKCEVVLQCI